MKKIFVGNLSFNATEDAVQSMFAAYGTVDSVSLVTDRDTGQARGFGVCRDEQRWGSGAGH
jgi:RNA recognition motif-containing protein